MRSLALLLAFFFLGLDLSAQENCSNGIDDDGDGLVDLNDISDCSCALSASIPSLLPNPSLENFDANQPGCNSAQPGGLPDGTNQANCLTDWQRVSLGTTDSWNAFTFTGAGPYFPEKLPLPLPSGTGVGGFWVGIKDGADAYFVNGDGSTTTRYREYLAAGLVDGQRMETGQAYRLTFSLGFMERQVATDGDEVLDIQSPAPVKLSIYGVRKREQLNFGDFYGCPEEAKAEGYELITNVTIDGTAGKWTAALVNFVAAGTYEGFAIGGSCGADQGRADGGFYRNYYFIDNLILNTPDAFAQVVAGPVAVDGLTVCDERITLTGQPNSGATYQWFRNGVAISEATDRVLTLRAGASVDGRYVMQVSTTLGCALTQEVNIQRPIITDQFPDKVAICGPGDTIVVSPRRNSGATYRWSDGSTGRSLAVADPGTYSVTVTESCIEHVEAFVADYDSPLDYQIEVSPVRPCVGEVVTIRVTSNSYAPKFFFRSFPDERMLPSQNGEVQVIAGETDAVLAFVGNKCGLVMDTIVITPTEPFQVTSVEVTDIECQTGTGQISVAVEQAAGATFVWADEFGNVLGSTSPTLEVADAGFYTLTVSDPDHCDKTVTAEVAYQASFTANFTLRQGSCGTGGEIDLLDSNGQLPLTIDWYLDGGLQPVFANASARTDLVTGNYTAVVTDASGCSLEQQFAVTGAPPLELTATPGFLDCNDPSSGTIRLHASGGTAPYAYRLDGHPAQQSADFHGLTPGSYYFTIQDASGCSTAAEPVTLTPPTPATIDLGSDQLINLGESTVLGLPYDDSSAGKGTYQWSPAPGLSCTDCASPEVMPTKTTEYTLTYTNENNCSSTDRILVRVNQTPQIYVPTAFSPNGDDHNDRFRVYGSQGVASVTDLRVFDRWGELVWQQDSEEDGGWDGTFRGKPLDNGVFAYAGSVLLNNGARVAIEGSIAIVR